MTRTFLMISTVFFSIVTIISPRAQTSDSTILFSHRSGYYDSAFTLHLTANVPYTNILYTTDGSNPLSSPSADTAVYSTNIVIDPLVDTLRPATPAVLIRAIAMANDTAIGLPAAATYIFLDQVRVQSYPGDPWPDTDVKEQIIDYDMDQSVSLGATYGAQMDSVLLDIPTISVITDNKNLFSPSTGIYVNALGHGPQWERPCSVALINPDSTPGFFINAGLRIRGGWSRHPNFPKHAFRLFFRQEYGTAKLHFPLFDDEGVDEFDKVDLRCAQNYAWSNSGGKHNTFVREVFSRDMQHLMGHPYTRSRYYHLFLNGMYWGLYQTQERAEARYAASYFGGSHDDYDVIKVDTEDFIYLIEATDGTTASWKRLWEMSNKGFFSNKDYFALEGKNIVGKPVPGQEILVDIDNLIDYMLLIFYTGNYDAPVTQFAGNDKPNNFYAIYNRTDKSKGFVFLAHDSEHSMMVDQVNVGIGLQENRVNIASISGKNKMETYDFNLFNPQWLHYKLTANREYRIRFADRAEKYLSRHGLFTPERARGVFDARAAQIDLAIIGESARWGDAKKYTSYTKNNAWLPELNVLRNKFFPNRTNIVVNQLKQAGLYSKILSPDFLVADSLFYEEKYPNIHGLELTLQNPNGAGKIYYTLDGTDPRLTGGAPATDALTAADGEKLFFPQSAVLKARIWLNEDWSAVHELTLIGNQEDLSALKITELNYHPKDEINGVDTLQGTDLEFIEFKNTGPSALHLGGITLDSAVHYVFPDHVILPPGQFYVVASKPSAFYEKYGLVASGNFAGNLSNSGEVLIVKSPDGAELMHIHYDDNSPWPDKADGRGPSLAAIHTNPTGDPYLPAYWRPSIYAGGSPFRDDVIITSIEHAPELSAMAGMLVYPNPATKHITINIPDLAATSTLHIKLHHINGSIIYSETVKNNHSIDLESLHLTQGLYLITASSNGHFYTQKLSVTH